MTILETLAQIPPMLYVSMVLLPMAFYGFIVVSKPKKNITPVVPNPGQQLKEKKVDVGRETTTAIFLGATVAFGVAIIIFIGGIVVDYKNDQGLFATMLPLATIPLAPIYDLPPAPKTDDQGGIVGKNNTIDTKKAKDGLLQ